MRDNRPSRRFTPILLTSILSLAVVFGPRLSAVAQGKPTPAQALKAAVAKAKQLEAQLNKLKANATKAQKAVSDAADALKAQQAATAKIAVLQEAELKKKADAIAAQQKAAAAATKAARAKAQGMKDEVAKLKAAVAKATNDQKAAEKNVKPQTDAAKKATDAKTAADKEAAIAAKALADAQKRCRKEVKALAKCSQAQRKKPSKDCSESQRALDHCLGKRLCKPEAEEYTRCWNSWVSSGYYRGQNNCAAYLEPMRACLRRQLAQQQHSCAPRAPNCPAPPRLQPVR